MEVQEVLQEKSQYLRRFADVHDERFQRAGISAADAMRMAAMMLGDDFQNYSYVFFGEKATPKKTDFVAAVETILEGCGQCNISSVCKVLDVLRDVCSAGLIPPDMASKLPTSGKQCDGQNFLYHQRVKLEQSQTDDDIPF